MCLKNRVKLQHSRRKPYTEFASILQGAGVFSAEKRFELLQQLVVCLAPTAGEKGKDPVPLSTTCLVMSFGLFFFREADFSALQERSRSRDLHSFCFHISTWLVHNRRAAAGSLSISKSRMLQCGAAGKQFYLSLFFYPLGSF
jgi:hypothetical protein